MISVFAEFGGLGLTLQIRRKPAARERREHETGEELATGRAEEVGHLDGYAVVRAEGVDLALEARADPNERGAHPHQPACLADLGILAAPGDFYGAAGDDHVRIALTATDERIQAAAARLAG